MSRPETYDDIDSLQHRIELASFATEKIAANSALLKAVASVIDAAEKAGGWADSQYSRLTVYRPASEEELASSLKSEQTSWDHSQKLYDQWRSQGTVGMADWQVNTAKRHAKAEGLDWIDADEPDTEKV